MNTPPIERPSDRRADVSASSDGERLDRFLVAALADLSRSRIKQLIKAGHLRLADGDEWRTIEDVSVKVKPGQRYRLAIPAPEPATPKGETIPLDIRFEDEHLIVIDKPAGLVVHPSAGHASGTLVNALIGHCGDSLSGIGGVKRPGIVHRLDKDTSGLMVVAKSDAVHVSLSRQFEARTITRAYWALCWGAPRPRGGSIAGNIGRAKVNRKKMAVVKFGGKLARTDYKVLRTFGAANDPIVCLIECHLQTGRTHQIRVHLTHAGHPILGDRLYGRGRQIRGLPEDAAAAVHRLGRQALHAQTLGFSHPIGGKHLTFESILPSEIEELVHQLALM